MKIDLGKNNYRPKRNPGYLKKIYRSGTNSKWVIQLVVSCVVFLMVWGLYGLNIPFTGILKTGIRDLMSYEVNIGSVFSKIVQLASQSGNIYWPTVDDTLLFSEPVVQKETTEPVILFPVSGKIIRPYGWVTNQHEQVQEFNEGIDISVPSGTEVKAVFDGNVVRCGERDGNGQYVLIKAKSGEMVRYSELSEIMVVAGQTVKAGDIIAKTGMPKEGEPHLHFEIIVDGKPVDPLSYYGLDLKEFNDASGAAKQ